MDCRTAVDILELADPAGGDGDVSSSRREAAEEHLRECARCATQLEAIRKLDRQIADEIADVSVPAGLKERILNALDSSRDLVPPRPAESAAAEKSGGGFRRNWKRVASAAAVVCLLAAAAGLWFWYASQRETWSIDQIRAELDSAQNNLELLPEFDGNFLARLPSRRWEYGISGLPRGLLKASGGKHAAAVYAFHFGEYGEHRLDGVLLVIPTSRVADPPEKTTFTRTYADYEPRNLIAWKREDLGLVYICVVPQGSSRTLDVLQQVLNPDLATLGQAAVVETG